MLPRRHGDRVGEPRGPLTSALRSNSCTGARAVLVLEDRPDLEVHTSGLVRHVHLFSSSRRGSR
jgi:hypothetical protein